MAEERGEGSAVQTLKDLGAHAALELPEDLLVSVRRQLEKRSQRIVEVLFISLRNSIRAEGL